MEDVGVKKDEVLKLEDSEIEVSHTLGTNPTVTVNHHLGEKSIQTNRDSADVLRHIIKNVLSRLVGTIQSPTAVTKWENFFFPLKKEVCVGLSGHTLLQ